MPVAIVLIILLAVDGRSSERPPAGSVDVTSLRAFTRALTSFTQIFTAENFRGFISDSISSELTKLKVIIGEHADSGERQFYASSTPCNSPQLTLRYVQYLIAFDLADLFFRFTLESFGQMAFGTHIGALSPGRPAPVPFGEPRQR